MLYIIYTRKTLHILAETKPGTRIKVLSVESSELLAEVQHDLSQLATQAIPPDLLTKISSTSNIPRLLNLTDVCFIVDGHKFSCHKVLLFAENSSMVSCES